MKQKANIKIFYNEKMYTKKCCNKKKKELQVVEMSRSDRETGNLKYFLRGLEFLGAKTNI